MSQPQYELERQQLIKECHSLLALIAQKPYAIKLLHSARDGLLLVAGYKSNRIKRR